jgi:hypothetical protein
VSAWGGLWEDAVGRKMVVEWGIVREGAAERADLVTLRALVALADMRGREIGGRIGM